MTWMDWYNSLWKPSWTPAPATIGLIWQILYPIIILTFGFVFVQAIRRKLPWSVAVPFAVNLVANLIFTPIQFGLRNLPLAAVDILIVWVTIIWMMVVVPPLVHNPQSLRSLSLAILFVEHTQVESCTLPELRQ